MLFSQLKMSWKISTSYFEMSFFYPNQQNYFGKLSGTEELTRINGIQRINTDPTELLIFDF